MIRLNVVVEGDTEWAFARGLLVEHLLQHGVLCIPMKVVTSRAGGRTFRGGAVTYGRIRGDVIRCIRGQPTSECRVTTMFDLYGLPRDFPGSNDAAKATDCYQKVQLLEDAFARDIDDWRFMPYLQLHEFEALILTDPLKFSVFFPDIGRAALELAEMSAGCGAPERIDDSPEGAPSKRIARVFPPYAAAKATAGPRIAEEIGLDTMRAACPHFDEWVTKLEQLGSG